MMKYKLDSVEWVRTIGDINGNESSPTLSQWPKVLVTVSPWVLL